MQNNPFANIFRQAFEKDVLSGAVMTPRTTINHAPRIKAFMSVLNTFLRQAGERPILYQHYAFNEQKLREYALFLRGYMRDAQKVLASLEQKYALDADLIRLFAASSEYVVASNHQTADKRIYDNNVGYRIRKIDLAKGLERAVYEANIGEIAASTQNLFLFMPFRLKDNEQMLSKWMFKTMRQTFDNRAVFAGKNGVASYVVHFPIEKSRSSNITSLLQTLQHSEDYFETQDMDFVRQYWLPYVAKELKADSNNLVQKASPYSASELSENMKKLTIFSYCAGTANAHRCLNALYYIGAQIYGAKTMKQAMKNVFVCSYGYLPLQAKSLYSGAHFYTHALQDSGRREPFVNLNNHALYEKTKNTETNLPAQVSVMPDGRNYIVALNLAPEIIYTENNVDGFANLKDGEFGHNMLNVSTPNLKSADNYAHRLFQSVIENSSQGRRGQEVFNLNNNAAPINTLQNAVIWSRRNILQMG